jgi:hypothetical protein
MFMRSDYRPLRHAINPRVGQGIRDVAREAIFPLHLETICHARGNPRLLICTRAPPTLDAEPADRENR